MTTVQQLYEAMQRIAPLELAESWDNPGLLVDCSGEVTRVLVTLDITPEVVTEAAAKHCEAIVAHHPVIFDHSKAGAAGCAVPAGAGGHFGHLHAHQSGCGCRRRQRGAGRYLWHAGPGALCRGCGRVGSIEPITVPQLARKAQQELAARCNAPDAGPAVQVKFADTGKAGAAAGRHQRCRRKPV